LTHALADRKEVDMKHVFSKFTALFFLLFAVFALPSFAQNETVMDVHVNQAVAIPGHVLRPGDYVFRLVESVARPADVEVMSADGKALYGVFPVYDAYRTSDVASEITTAPDESGLARIDAWYFPGYQDGYRFIYSNSDLRKIETIAQTKATKVAAGF